ncbi:DUF6022 family protein [Paenibacillus sedimenti]|uniref:Uncharacterized protein n=1 Tax=Paenibacillus sedimenti TaxID=2770274 RepID=A0A926KTQ7_9BACL|nr:DUF6022 family protein [Paenibacillus sedimenti]MBD0384032.1 hypothetical protein [Paenibacillus sedimenti]
MSSLTETLKGTTMRMMKNYVQQYIDHNYQQVWDKNLPEIERIFAKGGDSAYGFYCLKLFEPLMAEIVGAGFVPRPVLPGTFPQSEEHWGLWEDRERRFWSVIHQENRQPLGTLVSRIYHDHTRPRLPRPPQVYLIRETDPTLISHVIVNADPECEEPMDGGNGSYE